MNMETSLLDGYINNRMEKQNTFLQMFKIHFFHNFTWAFEGICGAVMIVASRGQNSATSESSLCCASPGDLASSRGAYVRWQMLVVVGVSCWTLCIPVKYDMKWSNKLFWYCASNPGHTDRKERACMRWDDGSRHLLLLRAKLIQTKYV